MEEIIKTQREAEGFWLSPDLLLGGTNEGKGGGGGSEKSWGLFL